MIENHRHHSIRLLVIDDINGDRISAARKFTFGFCSDLFDTLSHSSMVEVKAELIFKEKKSNG